MTSISPTPQYVIGNTLEHKRLIRQAALLAPFHGATLPRSRNRYRATRPGSRLAREAIQRSGAKAEMGLALYRMFQQAGLPPPNMKMEVPLRDDPQWLYELLRSLLPDIERIGLPLQALGEFSTSRISWTAP